MSKHTKITIGIDFDGTLAGIPLEPYPAIGRDLGAVKWLMGLFYNPRVELVLWTMREGNALDSALSWCYRRGLGFDHINEVPGQSAWADHTDGPCRKTHFSILVDDCALGAPLILAYPKPHIDWAIAGPELITRVADWIGAHPMEKS